MTTDDLRRKARDLLRIASEVESRRTRALLREADAAMRSSRTLITAARRQLAQGAR